MRSGVKVLLAPLVSTALFAGVAPAVAEEPAPSAPVAAQESVEGQGPLTPGAVYDGTVTAAEPAPVAMPDGTVELVVQAGRWIRAGNLPVRVRGVAGSPARVRITLSTGPDVAERGGSAAVLVERADGSDAPAPVRLALDTAALGGVFKANFVHRMRLSTSRACVALLHPHEDQGNHKSRAYAYGRGKFCPTTEPVDVPITDDPGDGSVEFDATAGADEEATEATTDPGAVDGTGDSSADPASAGPSASDAATSDSRASQAAATGETTSDVPAEDPSVEPTTAPEGGTEVPDGTEGKGNNGNNGVRDHGAGEGRAASPKGLLRPSVRSASTSGGTAYLLSAGPSGSAGSFAATPLAPSTLWQVGEQSGDFGTSYPVPVPPSPAGDAPQIALSYSSQSVDGRTSSTNNQASWVGLGWDYAPGSIQRRYGACAQDGHPAIGDLCWKTDNAVLSLGGRSVPLYRAANGLWHPADDDGVRVQRLAGAVNGARSGEYWVVTDRDGTRYTFGAGRQGTTNLATGSTWTVPVFGDDAGEPCHAASFAASRCNQAWTWNLDRITDTRGNTTTLFYAPETNRYGRLASPTLYTSYTRGGTLSRIEYGQAVGHENSPAPARVLFDTALRCNTATCAAPSTTNAASYPDVPVDLICADTFCAKQYTPVFFDTRRLASITTQVRSGAAYRTVDVLTLKQSFPSPGDGTDPTLWLSSITRTGYAPGTKTSLPPVAFGGLLLANRVDSSAALGVVPLNMYRLATVKGELGGVTTVTYGRPRPCEKTALPLPPSNTRDCYPAYWVPQFGPAGFGWFHKYLVTSVRVTDPVAGGPPLVTRYAYHGGAAWHHDENLIDPARTQSFGLWRGYGTTTVTTGTAVKSTTRSVWFRGMNGDPLPSGGTRLARVTDTGGTALADSEWLAGRLRESRQLSTAGVELTGAVTGYYASRTVDGPGLADSYVVLANRVDDRTRLSDPGTGAVTTRRTQTTTVYDPTYAQPTSVTVRGDTAINTDDVCVVTSYVRNTSAWILDTPNLELTRAGTCTGAPLGRTEHDYDGHPLTAAPSRGEQTQTRTFTDGTQFVRTQVGYDARGRVTSSTDGKGHQSRTVLTEAYPYGPVTASTSTNVLGHTSTASIDPGRGAVTASTDPNGHRTRASYDALGRLVKVWLPGQPDATPSRTLTYAVRQNAPSTVLSSTRQDDTTTLRQATVLDALGRPVESSTPVDGGRAVVQTRYDDRGLVAASTAPMLSSTALTSLLRPDPSTIVSETRTSYDELGRPTRTGLWSKDAVQYATTLTHFGGATRTTPPVGTPTVSIQDALGRTTRLEQRLPGKVLATSYSYDRLGQLLSVTDSGRNVSRFSYDLLGRQRVSSTPDAGTTSTTYDTNSNPVTTTDPRGVTVTTDYDELDRPIRRSSNTATLAAFSYDAPGALGLPASSTTADRLTAQVDSYDNRNRPTSRTLSVPASEGQLAGSWTTTVAYDEAGHVTTVQLPAVADLPAEQLSTTYDAYGRPDTTTGLEPYVSNTRYDAQSRVTQRTLGTGSGAGTAALTRGYTYDPTTGRQTRLTTTSPSSGGAGLVQDDQILYDPVGNVSRVTDLLGQRQCNTYDGLNRLVHAWTSSTNCTDENAPSDPGTAPYDLRYTLADTGQLLARHSSSAGSTATTAYTYGGPQPHAATSVAGRDYTYDPAGELTTRTGPGDDLTLTWGPEGTISNSTVTPDTGPSTQESYAYSTSGTRLLRRGANTSVLDLGGTELTLTGEVLTARRYYSSGGATIAVRTATGLSWLLGDRQGGPALTIASDGTSQRQLFGPYGEQRVNEQTDTVRGFLNKPHDTSTGLTILDHRSYDADLNRFLSPDPIYQPYNPGSFDAYSYANGNPTTSSDPSGLIPCSVCGTFHRILTGVAAAGSGVGQFVVNSTVNLASSASTATLNAVSDGVAVVQGDYYDVRKLHGPVQNPLHIDQAPRLDLPDYGHPTIKKTAETATAVVAALAPLGEAALALQARRRLQGLRAVAAEAGGTGLRAARQAYVDGARAIADDGAAQIAAGADASTVARGAVDARNALKATAREGMPGPLRSWAEWRNTRRYGDPIGPSYDYFVGQGKLPEQIVGGAGRTSDWINWLMGVG